MDRNKAVILLVGFLFAIMTFDYVYSKVMESCSSFFGCDAIAIIAGLIAFSLVLGFFSEELRVYVKTILKLR
jgi:hypothetical protein